MKNKRVKIEQVRQLFNFNSGKNGFVHIYDQNGNRFYANDDFDSVEYIKKYGIVVEMGVPLPISRDGSFVEVKKGAKGIYIKLTPFVDDDFVDNDIMYLSLAHDSVINALPGHAKIKLINELLTSNTSEEYKREKLYKIINGYTNNGLIVIHTGKIDRNMRQIIQVYDQKGNLFCGNHDNLTLANLTVDLYKKHGIAACVGLKGPLFDVHGELIEDSSEDSVGVYVDLDPQLEKKLASISAEEYANYERIYREIQETMKPNVKSNKKSS